MASVTASPPGFHVPHLELATGFWSRFRGLMLRTSLPEGGGLLIEPCGSIHMLFMRFPLDIVFYNREGIVTKVATGVRPWIGLASGGRKSRGVLELPAGAAAGLEVGHQLIFDR